MASFEPKHTGEWQVECSTIKQRSVHLYNSHQWTDCRFCFDPDGSGKESDFLEAHSLILAMASPVFAAMFFGVAGNKESPIVIVDIDVLTFKSMLDYIYTEEIYIPSIEMAMSLCLAANKYILPHLEMACAIYLVNHLNPDNVCHIYEFACFCGDQTIKSSCIQIIKTKTLEVFKGESFGQIQLSTLKEIVVMDPLNIESELDILNAVFAYFQVYDNRDLILAERQDVGKKHKLSNERKNVSIENNNNRKGNNINIKGNNNSIRRNTSNSILKGNNNKAKKYLFSTDSNNNLQQLESKRINLREKMKGVVEQLRFLRLTPSQLAKCKKLQSILTKEELFTLSMKISTPLPQMPVPVGLSASMLPRNDRGQLFIHTRFVLRDLSRFVPTGPFKGDYFCAQNIPFEVHIRMNKSKIYTKNEKCLVIFLSCKKRCEVHFRTKLVSHKPSVQASSEMVLEKTVFCGPRFQREHNVKYSMRSIRDPAMGVLVDDCLIVELHITPLEIYSPPEECPTNSEEVNPSDHLQKMRDYLNNMSARRF